MDPMRLPEDVRWLFWDVEFPSLDSEQQPSFILARILEHGRLADVRWAIQCFGCERIHQFFREVGHPELSARTLAFWRAFFTAEQEKWATPPDWRRASAVPWPA